MAAVLDRDPFGRPDVDPAGDLLRRQGRRRDRAAPVPPRHRSAARQPLSGADVARDDLSVRRLQHDHLRDRRRAGQFDASVGDALHPRRLRPRQPAPRRGGGADGDAADDPLGDDPDAQAEDGGGAAVTTTTADTTLATREATHGANTMRRTARRWRYLS